MYAARQVCEEDEQEHHVGAHAQKKEQMHAVQRARIIQIAQHGIIKESHTHGSEHHIGTRIVEIKQKYAVEGKERYVQGTQIQLLQDLSGIDQIGQHENEIGAAHGQLRFAENMHPHPFKEHVQRHAAVGRSGGKVDHGADKV